MDPFVDIGFFVIILAGACALIIVGKISELIQKGQNNDRRKKATVQGPGS